MDSLIEPPLETAASAIATTANSGKKGVGQVDAVSCAAHTLVADSRLNSGSSVGVLDGK